MGDIENYETFKRRILDVLNKHAQSPLYTIVSKISSNVYCILIIIVSMVIVISVLNNKEILMTISLSKYELLKSVCIGCF